jgi:3-oxoacyl-[acyl-carrier-protein] synthase-3
MKQAAITAVGHYVPEKRLTNADLEQMVDTSDEWIRTRTGIRERRIAADDEATSDMAAEAARELIRKNGVDPAAIDAIVVGTVTPDMLFPATACLIQEKIGAENAWGFDLSAACSGFMYALATGARFIESGQHEKVLVIGADTMSSIIDYEDRSTCILFGDGAGAVLLEPDDEYGVTDIELGNDANDWEQLCMLAGGSRRPASPETVEKKLHVLRQDGRPVFKRAVSKMTEITEGIMERGNLAAEDVRYLVPHQANERIISATADSAGLPMERVMLNIDRYGNTTAATIPLCLADYEDDLRPGDNLILVAFGGGFTWSAAHIRWAYNGLDVSAGT